MERKAAVTGLVLGVVSVMIVAAPAGRAQDIEFIERFALADDRAEVLGELIPGTEEYYFFHPEFDSFVYRMMLDEDLERAVPLFEKLAVLFPSVPNAFDSLGEAYLRQEKREKAAAAFERCLELDPEHRNARTRLRELGGIVQAPFFPE